MEINYLVGDATTPQVGIQDKTIIAHVCNDVGAWGAGFVKALSAKWSTPEDQYKRLGKKNRQLGSTQLVVVGNNKYVANIIGQRDIKPNAVGLSPVRYGAIEQGLREVFKFAATIDATVHMPRIGCGLAGGKWSIMEAVIKSAAEVYPDVKVYVYDFTDADHENYVKANLN